MVRKSFLLLVPLLLGLMAGPALAQATSTTETVHGVSEEFVDLIPCTGDSATIRITYNAVFHGSTAANGSMHVTGTLTGTVVVTPEDSSLPTYTGRFTTWFGGNINSKNQGFWETFSVRLVGSDGSTLTLNEVEQFHMSATGEITVDFANENCH
jgi:hypothetical protein